MRTMTACKLSVLSAFLVFLTACGGSDQVYVGSGAGTGINTAEPSGSTDANSSNDASSNARPLFVTSDCGSLPISDLLPGNERSSPTTIAVGQLVSGRIDPDSAGNYEHFWRIALEPGSYNVVFDAETVAGNYKYLNTRLTDLNGPGSEDDDALIKIGESNYRARYHEFIEIEQARIMDIVITTSSRAEDYRFAIFENGSPVPSPLFSDCPTIKLLSLDTTEALSLPEQTSSDDDRWYLVDLEAKDYVLDSRAATTNCEDGGIEYEISHVDQFGQHSRMIDHERIQLEANIAPAAHH